MASFNASHEEILSLNPLTPLGLIFQNFNFINSKYHNTKIYPTKIHISFILLIRGLGWVSQVEKYVNLNPTQYKIFHNKNALRDTHKCKAYKKSTATFQTKDLNSR